MIYIIKGNNKHGVFITMKCEPLEMNFPRFREFRLTAENFCHKFSEAFLEFGPYLRETKTVNKINSKQ